MNVDNNPSIGFSALSVLFLDELQIYKSISLALLISLLACLIRRLRDFTYSPTMDLVPHTIQFRNVSLESGWIVVLIFDYKSMYCNVKS